MEPNTFCADGSRALGAVGHCLLRFIVVFVTEHFLLFVLLAHRLSSGKGMQHEAPSRDSERVQAAHPSLEALLLAGCLVTEWEGVEGGKVLDLLHFILTAGAGETEASGLQQIFKGSTSFGYFETNAS